MTVFSDYARYYNLLYKDKDYHGEMQYVTQLLNKHNPLSHKICRILDLGCGTGRHDILFAQNGFQVTGVDLSDDMLKIARKNELPNLSFIQGDVRTISLATQFDAVLSLFHVASYQTRNNDLDNYFRTASNHLRSKGIFIFDFWYGPAVLTDLPQNRKKLVEDNVTRIERKTTSTIHPNENRVEVIFDVKMIDKETQAVEETRETHNMRYWFLPEIEAYLATHQFSISGIYKWMTLNPVGFDSWYGVVAAVRD